MREKKNYFAHFLLQKKILTRLILKSIVSIFVTEGLHWWKLEVLCREKKGKD